ncbi:uncharacterized protein DSM5745_07799 [Aspergillus mulundensis]|uniref:Uncharacterized protein n=1 Tax=Aspergillus mulundensis TaxID=1810919 RepID=A0A3D8RF12_9EURO|nr:hypothetical protein DSM5745_07799 [Aspergillus mulundensis]RDW72627.1 hypothetical protein DSM5745_07799 [Aspergillus mulundensis]
MSPGHALNSLKDQALELEPSGGDSKSLPLGQSAATGPAIKRGPPELFINGYLDPQALLVLGHHAILVPTPDCRLDPDSTSGRSSGWLRKTVSAQSLPAVPITLPVPEVKEH